MVLQNFVSLCIRLLWSAKALTKLPRVMRMIIDACYIFVLTHFFGNSMWTDLNIQCILLQPFYVNLRHLNVPPNVNLQNYFWAFELSGSKLPYGPLNLRNIERSPTDAMVFYQTVVLCAVKIKLYLCKLSLTYCIIPYLLLTGCHGRVRLLES